MLQDINGNKLNCNINHTKYKEYIKQYILNVKNNKKSRLQSLKTKLEKLEQTNEGLKGCHDIHTHLENMNYIKQIQEQIHSITTDTDLEQVVEQIHPYTKYIKNIHDIKTYSILQQRQIQNLFSKKFEKVDRNIHLKLEECPKCSDRLLIENDATLVCHACGYIENLLYCNNDFDCDTLDFCTGPTYDRSPLYRKYLNQFSDRYDIPENIIKTVYDGLNNIHITGNVKIRPTPIINILRKAKMTRWVHFAVRIAKYFNNESVIPLNDILINRLVKRFEILTTMFLQSTHTSDIKKKILNFEFLTRQFLLMENRPDLAQSFMCHKTRSVLTESDNRLLKIVSRLCDSDTEFSWKVHRNC